MRDIDNHFPFNQPLSYQKNIQSSQTNFNSNPHLPIHEQVKKVPEKGWTRSQPNPLLLLPKALLPCKGVATIVAEVADQKRNTHDR